MLHYHDSYRVVQRHHQEAQAWADADRLARLAKTTARTDAGRSPDAHGVRPLVARWSRRITEIRDAFLEPASRQGSDAPVTRTHTPSDRGGRRHVSDRLSLLLRRKRLRRMPGSGSDSSVPDRTVWTMGRPAPGHRARGRGTTRRTHGPARSALAARTGIRRQGPE
jgi:hypothetical protein